MPRSKSNKNASVSPHLTESDAKQLQHVYLCHPVGGSSFPPNLEWNLQSTYFSLGSKKLSHIALLRSLEALLL